MTNSKSPIESMNVWSEFPGSVVRKFLFQVQGVAGNPCLCSFSGACLGPLQGTLGIKNVPPPELFKSITFPRGYGVPDLANKNTGSPVQFKFQINNQSCIFIWQAYGESLLDSQSPYPISGTSKFWTDFKPLAGPGEFWGVWVSHEGVWWSDSKVHTIPHSQETPPTQRFFFFNSTMKYLDAFLSKSQIIQKYTNQTRRLPPPHSFFLRGNQLLEFAESPCSPISVYLVLDKYTCTNIYR